MMHKTNIWKRGGGALAYLSSHCAKAVRHDSEHDREVFPGADRSCLCG